SSVYHAESVQVWRTWRCSDEYCPRLDTSWFRRASRGAEDGLDGVEARGLDEVGVEAGPEGAIAVLGLAVAGHGDDEGARVVPDVARAPAARLPVHARKADIEHHDLGAGIRGGLERRLAVVRDGDLVA